MKKGKSEVLIINLVEYLMLVKKFEYFSRFQGKMPFISTNDK